LFLFYVYANLENKLHKSSNFLENNKFENPFNKNSLGDLNNNDNNLKNSIISNSNNNNANHNNLDSLLKENKALKVFKIKIILVLIMLNLDSFKYLNIF